MQLRALCRVRRLERIQAYDQDAGKAAKFAKDLSAELGIPIVAVNDLAKAVASSDIVITCTTSKRFFITHGMVRPGTFIAAVGADNPDIGDLHHAIDAKVMTRADVHAELGQVAAGLKSARTSDDQIIVFDSSGTALQDVAAAAAVYRRATGLQHGLKFSFNA